jgi:prepilin-type N-terminal cleavage/methylation domain-containing protein/prepilin-type processing-associated H-X9-DG protein
VIPSVAKQRKPSAHGFSLLELLLCTGIILVLIVIYFGAGSLRQGRQRKLACEKNLQTIYLALDIYARENKGVLPADAGGTTSEVPLSQLVPRYTVASDRFICPGSRDTPLPDGEPFANRRISYAYLMGRQLGAGSELLMSDRQVDGRPKKAGELVFSRDGKPPGNNHQTSGGNYLFSDGHTESGGLTAPFPITWPSNVTLLNPKP